MISKDEATPLRRDEHLVNSGQDGKSAATLRRSPKGLDLDLPLSTQLTGPQHAALILPRPGVLPELHPSSVSLVFPFVQFFHSCLLPLYRLIPFTFCAVTTLVALNDPVCLVSPSDVLLFSSSLSLFR